MSVFQLSSVLLAFTILLSTSALADADAGDLDQRIKTELATFYKVGEPTPPWKKAVDALANGADDRVSAGTYLRALLAQAAEDEASGEAPWRATPFWGSSGENPARNLREAIVESLAERESLTDAATPAIAWVLEHEKVPAFQHDAANALKATHGTSADRLIARLITPETTNHAVLCIAIEAASDRPTLHDHAETIAQLAAHHQTQIRQTAGRVAKAMGVDDLPQFDAGAAMRSKPVVSVMNQMSQFVELPPADAKFVHVTFTYPQPEGDPYVTTASGWQIKRDETWIELFSPHGSTQRVRLKPDPDADPEDKKPVIEVKELKISDVVASIERLRAGGDEDFELSEEGGLTGQFEGNGASVYEAILGLWLYESNRDELAARIVFPALDTLYADGYLAEMVRQRMGRNLGRQMLVAFIGNRDYETATRHAKRIAEDFPDTQFHPDAVALAAELPRRAADFKTLTLPTPTEWKKLQTQLSRGEQIDYLCTRLRLLNVYQFGQPGGISYAQTQWPTPQGLSADASWGGAYSENRSGELINPYTELTGDTGWRDADDEPEGMELTVNDISRLAEHLREDWHILAVSFWRDFHPSRNLHTTREILVSLIDGLAQDNLVDESKLADDEESIEAEIKRIKVWATKRLGRSGADLKLDAIHRVLDADGRYFDIRGQVGSLVSEGDQRVIPLLIKLLDRDGLSRWDRESLLRYLRQLEAPAALRYARKQHGKGSVGERHVAAVIELEAGDPVRAVKLLDAVLEEADYRNMSFGDIDDAIESLIKSGRDDARRVVAKQFADDRLLQYSNYGGSLPSLVRRVTDAGEPGGLAIFRRQLDNITHKRGNTTYGTQVSYTFADNFLDYYNNEDPGLSKICDTTESETDARVEALKKWLDGKIKTINRNDR